MRTLLTSGVIVAVSAFAATYYALRLARHKQVIAHPNERSSHAAPTPLGGGPGLGLIAAAALAVYGASAAYAHDEKAALWAAPALAVACWVGWRDDVRPLPPFAKLVLLTAAASALVALLSVSSVAVPMLGTLEFGVLTAPLMLFWLAGFTNAFNFMDGINGIAGLTALVSGVIYAIAGSEAHSGLVTALGVITAGCAAGFLPWNFPRARVFMGDAGSLVLGLLLAYTAVTADVSGALPFPASVLLLGPFIFDTALTLVRRALRGEKVWRAHREHLYQRLSRLWGSHTPVSGLYAGFAIVCGVLALGYRDLGDGGRLLSLGAPLGAMLVFAVAVLRADAKHVAGIPETGIPETGTPETGTPDTGDEHDRHARHTNAVPGNAPEPGDAPDGAETE
jgi:UDP-N-acetylmuramyl pentapeptide phosphotransferase/UDP-N-acetylglucosamine-1-phosphate transferase